MESKTETSIFDLLFSVALGSLIPLRGFGSVLLCLFGSSLLGRSVGLARLAGRLLAVVLSLLSSHLLSCRVVCVVRILHCSRDLTVVLNLVTGCCLLVASRGLADEGSATCCFAVVVLVLGWQGYRIDFLRVWA